MIVFYSKLSNFFNKLLKNRFIYLIKNILFIFKYNKSYIDNLVSGIRTIEKLDHEKVLLIIIHIYIFADIFSGKGNLNILYYFIFFIFLYLLSRLNYLKTILLNMIFQLTLFAGLLYPIGKGIFSGRIILWVYVLLLVVVINDFIKLIVYQLNKLKRKF